MISKMGHSCHAEKGIALGVLYLKTLFAHLATLPSLPYFSHSSKPLLAPPWFCWTLISCGSLFLKSAAPSLLQHAMQNMQRSETLIFYFTFSNQVKNGVHSAQPSQ